MTRAGVVSLNSTIVGLLDDALNINEAEKAIQALLVEQELTRKIITDQMDQLSSHMTTMHKELSQRTDQTASSVQSMRDEIFPVIRKSDTNITLSRAKPKAPG
ncbi:MAG: hypothetical protein NTZ54_09970 [Alphaproteobacteria bacterium]|nr:hypothetical protein [Alphaproteobacteria bacterium]